MRHRDLKAIGLLLFIILVGGCASHMSHEDLSSQWIARPLAELKEKMKDPDSYASKTGWKETTYPLSNGDYVYVEPINADCFIHWEVNPKDIIIGYQAKGESCKWKGPDSITRTQIRNW